MQITPSLSRLFIYLLRFPKLIVGLIFLLVSLLAVGMLFLQISNDFRVYLGSENPQMHAFEKFEADYVKSDTATFVVSAKDQDLFTVEGLRLIEALTQALWQLDYSYRVSSLTNYQFSQSKNDEIETNYLVEDASQLKPSEIESIRNIALTEKRLLQSLLTKDGKLSMVIANLNLPGNHANLSLEITQKMETIRNQYRILYPQFEIDNGGSTAFNATLGRAVANDMTTLLPLSYLIIFSGLFLFLRSFIATAVIFILITSCLIATFGFFGWIAPVLTPIAGFAPSILLSIMVADSVHILVTYFQQLGLGQDKQNALLTSLQINFLPVLITSATTMIGFLSLNFSVSPPYRDLGNMVAIGVLIAFLFSLILLPALLMILPTGKLPKKTRSHYFEKFARFVIDKKNLLMSWMIVLSLGLMLFIPSNKLSDNWANYFDDSFEVIKLVNRIDGYLTGINSLEYSFASNLPEGIFSPDYLQQLDAFEDWMLSQKKVVSVKSLSQLMKDINQLMHNDESDWYRIPQSAELAAQYLLFYQLGLPSALGLDNLVTQHQDAARLTVSVSNAGSDELLALDKRAQAWLQKNAPAIKLTPATGLGMVFAHIAQTNIRSLLFGTFLALIGISLILMLVLRSIKFGLISLIPNLIPAAMAYGIWGMSFGYVDISLSIVACSTLGIVVDDTVHFLHKYLRARRAGESVEKAIVVSFQTVGLALLTTSIVLASGFIILAVSPMNTSATIGLLMAITLVFALVVDFLLLPPLLIGLEKIKKKA